MKGLALAVTVPLALLLSVYLFAVQPRLEAARAARAEVEAVRGRLTTARAAVQTGPSAGTNESAAREFEMRFPDGDRVPDVLRTLTLLASAPSVGKLDALVIQAGGESGTGSEDPRLALFEYPVSSTPVTMSFEAGYEQVGRFFWSLRGLPTTTDVRAVEISAAPQSSRLQVKLLLVAFQRSSQSAGRSPTLAGELAQIAAPPPVDIITTPAWRRDLFQSPVRPAAAADVAPDPVVQTILYSPLRSAALVDGRIVKVGDRVAAGSVTAIEPDAVLIETPSGARKRLILKRPSLKGTISTP